jgi:outer membrane receptor for ferrienterochelin and colicin
VMGTFVEKGVNTPLAGVEVVLRSAADSTVVAHTSTGGDGHFRVDSLRFGRYLLRASLVGYTPYVRSDITLADSAPLLDLGTQGLRVSPIALKGVETSTARATAIIGSDRNSYLTKDMPMASSGTATDILRAVPELEVDINDKVSLRGSTSVNIQFNGRTAPIKGDALTSYLRQMPASRIERVEVIANPSAKFDPEGMAGIVNIVFKDNLGLGLSGSVNATTSPRYSGPSARVAWQKGPLTLFGGLSGTLYHYSYQSSTDRQGLLTSPPSSLLWEVDNHYKGRYGMADASVDYAIDKRSTLYGTFNGSGSGYDPITLTHYSLSDSTQALVSRYDRTDDGGWNNQTPSVTLGFQHVIQAGKNERSIEFIRSGTDGDNRNDGLLHTFVPAGISDQTLLQRGSNGYHERSVQIDDTHPVGKNAKLELGYRGARRVTTNSSELEFFADGGPLVTPLSGISDYEHRERFHSGYFTLGSTFGHLSLQGGARGEAAVTKFDVRSSGHHFDNDYRSLFPSANVAWDFGRGRNVRATYSKRIERPSPYYLDPDVRSSDSLNRFVGNPQLKPRYTHSWSVDASWTGSRGSLRVSPYLRETVDNWDVITRVDATGAAITTYLNASSVRTYGASVTGSLRQTGRVGGTLSLGVSQEHHDAGNLSSQFRRNVTGLSANGNVTYKATKTLDLQGYLRFAPARALAQGHASSYTALNLSSRLKLRETAFLSVSVNDPFNMSKYSSSTGDATYSQTSTSHNRIRSLSATVSWTWGKLPEEKKRRQTVDQPQQGSPEPGR